MSDRWPISGRALIDRIGETPLLPLPSPADGVRLLGKAEWMNPGGSVKDRAALGIVGAARSEGILPDRTLLDASSGNTAIAYAMLGAALGFDVAICLPENAGTERKRTLDAYGAETFLTDPVEGMDRARARARQMAQGRPDRYWYADQYSNPENWRAHYRGTGPEIWRETAGRLTHLVAGLGTTGTLVGSGRRLKELDPGVRLVAVEPDHPFHGLEGLKHLPSSNVPAIYDASLVDRRMRVSTEEGYRWATRLARERGLFVGPSSGAAYAAARRVAAELDRGVVAAVLPDGGSRYLAEAWWTGDAPGRLVLPRELMERIEDRAEDAYPGEGCGVLLGYRDGSDRVVRELADAPNAWSERNDRYAVDPDLLRELQEREDAGGPAVLGFYHSHPEADPVPSPTDREHAWPWYLYLIVGVRDGRAGQARAWEFEGAGHRPDEREIEITEESSGGNP